MVRPQACLSRLAVDALPACSLAAHGYRSGSRSKGHVDVTFGGVRPGSILLQPELE